MTALTPHAHLSDDVLVDYAAGTLSQATSLLVATHLALCPDCREEVRLLEAVGGALLAERAPEAPADHLLAGCLALLDQPITVDPTPARYCADGVIPRSLMDYLPADGLVWHKRAKGLAEIRLDTGPGPVAKLLKISAGQPMPRHTHTGREFTLVLDGSFSDDYGVYRRGDVAVATEGEIHQPIAGSERDCICLAVVEGSLALTGPIGRVLNLFVRF
jgi:putative transcriptional regulator